ncbi:MAG: hypothetical protein AAF899_07870 [Pseudomonadota bacterium]
MFASIGIVISVVIACFIVLQASAAGAAARITIPVAGGCAAVMAAFWGMAIETLIPGPDYWDRVVEQTATNFFAAGIGGMAFGWATVTLIAKINAFREKYPDR